MNRTTNLAEVKNGNPFTWGKVIEIHEIGEYSIIEYYSRDLNGSGPPYNYESIPSFHGYINGKSTSRSYGSLDEALVGVIGYKHDGSNSQAAMYFMRMIQASSPS